MAKKKEVVGEIKLHVPAGQANPAPPVGPALGQHGVNIMDFCSKFNAQTKDKQGIILPVIISVYKDRSFDFIIKSPPAPVLIKRAANLAKASSDPGKETISSITRDQLKQIANEKLPDLNTADIESAMRTIEGTARSMGISVVDEIQKTAEEDEE